jgi:hypothetical protein
MKKLALPLALIALAFSLGGMLPPVTAQARSEAPWEYRVFRLDPADYTDKADYKLILQREGPRGADSAFREHVLNHLGRDRWELVQVGKQTKALTYLYLKRPKL